MEHQNTEAQEPSSIKASLRRSVCTQQRQPFLSIPVSVWKEDIYTWLFVSLLLLLPALVFILQELQTAKNARARELKLAKLNLTLNTYRSEAGCCPIVYLHYQQRYKSHPKNIFIKKGKTLKKIQTCFLLRAKWEKFRFFQNLFKFLASWIAIVLSVKRNNKNSTELPWVIVSDPKPIDVKVKYYLLIYFKWFWFKPIAKDMKWSKTAWNKLKHFLRLKTNNYVIQNLQHWLLTIMGFNAFSIVSIPQWTEVICNKDSSKTFHPAFFSNS